MRLGTYNCVKLQGKPLVESFFYIYTEDVVIFVIKCAGFSG